MTTVPAPVDTRTETIAALLMLNALAKRDQHIVRKFSADPLTTWDRRHRTIDAKLTELVGA